MSISNNSADKILLSDEEIEKIENAKKNASTRNSRFDWIPEETKTVVVDYRGKFVKEYDAADENDRALPQYPRNTTNPSQ